MLRKNSTCFLPCVHPSNLCYNKRTIWYNIGNKPERRAHTAYCVYAHCASSILLWMIFVLNDIFVHPTQRVTTLCRGTACRAITDWVQWIFILRQLLSMAH